MMDTVLEVPKMQVKYSVPYNIVFQVDEYNQVIEGMKSAKELVVTKVKNTFANDFVLNHHYLHRKVYVARNVSYGLYAGGFCVGVCMFGFPVWTQYPGLCPPLLAKECPELTRLTTMSNLPKNSESYFVSQCIKKMLVDWKLETGFAPKIITSFCDNELGFDGAIYKATNFTMFNKTKGRSSNPGGKHGKWGGNTDNSNAEKTMYVYYYDRKLHTTLNIQPCGHPLSAIVHNGTTNYCGTCADDSLLENINKGIEA